MRFGKFARRFLAGAAALLCAALPAAANQSNAWSPTTGTVTGLQLTTNFNNAFTAILSCNSGTTAPANDQSAAAVKGQCWLDTSVSPNAVKMYDGASWIVVGWIDTTSHLWIANNGGGVVNIASASTTDLCGSGGNPQTNLGITGNVTITSFGSTCAAGTTKILQFTGAPLLTNSGTLVLPNNGSNIQAVAGDKAIVVYDGASTWVFASYQRFSGASLSATANFASNINFNSVISPAALAANTYDWNPAGLATANVIRLSCSSATTNQIGGIVAPAVDGQVIVLNNIGATNNCNLTAQDANETTAANRFAFDRTISIRPGRTLTIKYDATTARWVLWQEVSPQIVMGGFKNLRLLNVANAFGDTAPATPNAQYKIAFDELAVEDASGGTIRISGLTNIVDVGGTNTVASPVCTPTTAGSGAGGIDTGSVAATTWYFVWIIMQPAGITSFGTGTVSCMFSVSSTAPTMPAGYTHKARVGAIPTDGSSILFRMQQYGRIAHYVNVAGSNTTGPQTFASGNQATCSTASPALVSKTVLGNGFPAPLTATRVKVITNTQNNGGAGTCLLVAPSAAWSGANNGPTGTNGLVWPVNSAVPGIFNIWFTLESSALFYAASNNASNIAAIEDYEDNF